MPRRGRNSQRSAASTPNHSRPHTPHSDTSEQGPAFAFTRANGERRIIRVPLAALFTRELSPAPPPSYPDATVPVVVVPPSSSRPPSRPPSALRQLRIARDQAVTTVPLQVHAEPRSNYFPFDFTQVVHTVYTNFVAVFGFLFFRSITRFGPRRRRIRWVLFLLALLHAVISAFSSSMPYAIFAAHVAVYNYVRLTGFSCSIAFELCLCGFKLDVHLALRRGNTHFDIGITEWDRGED